MEEACVLYIREKVRIYGYVFKFSNLQRKTATDTNDHEIDRTLSISLALQKIQIKIISRYCHIDSKSMVSRVTRTLDKNSYTK